MKGTVVENYVGGVFFIRPVSGYAYYGWRSDTVYLCSCGNNFYGGRQSGRGEGSTVCNNCGNMVFYEIQRPTKTCNKTFDGVFDCKESTCNSFKIDKKELTINIIVNEAIEDAISSSQSDLFLTKYTFGGVKQGDTATLEYSLKDKIYNVYKNGVLLSPNDRNDDYFFRGGLNSSINPFFNAVSNDSNKEILKFAFSYLGKKDGERQEKWSRALKRLFSYPQLEIINNCGLGRHLHYVYTANYRYRGHGNPLATKPHEIFGIPKYMMKYVREMERLDGTFLKGMAQLDKEIGGNNLLDIIQIYKEESKVDNLSSDYANIIELYKNYGYKDMKKLVLYITREIKLQQGIVDTRFGLSLLRDYRKMCKDINAIPEKFPKSLKKEHDIVMMNYNVKRDQIKNEKFTKAVEQEDYKSLEYHPKKKRKKKTDEIENEGLIENVEDIEEENETVEEVKKGFVIVTPKTCDDLVNEGSSLSHCVASYVDNVIDGKCKILFMRNKENVDESLITIEVRDGNIRQVRGKFNRNPVDWEWNFVREWAKEKELVVSCH